MSGRPRIAVTSPSFSRHPTLRRELLELFADARLNQDGQRLAGAELREFLAGADGAVVGLEPVDGPLLDACPRLRIVAKYGVGLDNLDQAAMAAHTVVLGWTGGVNRRSVAELALCGMLGLCRNVFHTSQRLREEGVWHKSGGVQLTGRTVGIIGLGHAGKELAHLLAPFHCRILANDILARDDYCREHGLTPVSKEEIWAQADLITLHVPLTPLTHHLVNRVTLERMKPTAFLINTSRGEVVHNGDLKVALRAGRIAGAALDVFEEEPVTDREFLTLPNFIPTPHIGGNADEAVLAMGRSAIGHLRAFFGVGEGA
ncbi:MAG: phosphoglycerate dehydrogenase [Magnetococcales bacterium]|nr:phosphoglycerate dehydrogenase [Magnetococcales bacterium]